MYVVKVKLFKHEKLSCMCAASTTWLMRWALSFNHKYHNQGKAVDALCKGMNLEALIMLHKS